MRVFEIGARVLALGAVLAGASKASAQTSAATQPDKAHVMVRLADLQWRDPGRGLASATVEGDPSVSGAPYTIALRLRDGHWIRPHWHPLDKRVIVVQGTLLMGIGERLDSLTASVLPAGSFSVVPAKTRHYEGARGETIILLHGTGPLSTTYVEPARSP